MLPASRRVVHSWIWPIGLLLIALTTLVTAATASGAVHDYDSAEFDYDASADVAMARSVV